MGGVAGFRATLRMLPTGEGVASLGLAVAGVLIPSLPPISLGTMAWSFPSRTVSGVCPVSSVAL